MHTKLRVFQSYNNSDLAIRFQMEWSSHDRELISKFGDPDISVGGSFFTAARIHPVVNAQTGAITSVVVDYVGSVGAYSDAVDVEVVVTDPYGAGEDAVFSVAIAANGTIVTVTPTTQGTGYNEDTTLELIGDHVTAYPAQYVKLYAGFPYTRTVNTMEPGDHSLATLVTAYVAGIKSQIEAELIRLRAIETSGDDLTTETVYQP